MIKNDIKQVRLSFSHTMINDYLRDKNLIQYLYYYSINTVFVLRLLHCFIIHFIL